MSRGVLAVVDIVSYMVLSQGVKDVPAEAFIKAFAAVSHRPIPKHCACLRGMKLQLSGELHGVLFLKLMCPCMRFCSI